MDFGTVDIVDHHITLHRNAVCAIRVVEEGNLHALHIGYKRIVFCPFSSVAVCADVRHPEHVELVKRAAQPGIATVKAMIVGMQKQVESSVLERNGIFLRRAEARIALIRFSSKRAFKIYHSIVGSADIVCHMAEICRIVK